MAYFLRTTRKDGKSYGGFQWPLKVGATVTAPDWNPVPVCGWGLHGLMDGLGDSYHLSFDSTALWWVVEAEDSVDLDGKHKFQSCRVVLFGDRASVTTHLYNLRPGPIHMLCMAVGDKVELVGGDYAKLTGGHFAKLTGGPYSVLTGGEGAILTGGEGSKLVFLRCINEEQQVLIAYVGENGIDPGVAYRANNDHTAVVEVGV